MTTDAGELPIEGTVGDGFEGVREAFVAGLDTGELGAGVGVYVEGMGGVVDSTYAAVLGL